MPSFYTQPLPADGRTPDEHPPLPPNDVDVGLAREVPVSAPVPEKLRALEHQLRDQAQFYRVVFEANVDGVFVINERGIVVDMNGSALRLLGYSKDQLLGGNISRIMPEPWASHHDEYLERYIRTGQAKVVGIGRSVVARCASGDCFPAELTVCEASFGGERLFIGTLRDVSERTAAEAEKELLVYEAQVQEQRLRVAAGAAKLGVWELDVVNGHLEWDERSREICGFPDGVLAGSFAGALTLLPEEEGQRLAQVVEQAYVRGDEFHENLRITTPSGEIKHILLRAASIRDVSGAPMHLAGVVFDVTEQVLAEERLRRALREAEAANRVKTEFLTTMSHELRTPMNGVLGMASLLLGTPLDETQREYADTIHASGENLLSMINNILDFSKIEAGSLTLQNAPFSLRAVLGEIVQLFLPTAVKHGVQLTLWVAGEVPELVSGDAARVRQVVLGVVSNAVKFTERGQVVVSCGVAPDAGQGAVQFTVQDTGIGMSDAFLAAAGAAFYQEDASATRHHGGAGLGLAIAKNLLRLMHGQIEITSARGVGTTVRITVPLQALAPVSRPAVVRAPARLARVLVVEDNVVNQRVIVQMLKSFADQVDVANDGVEGVQRFCSAGYDCVFMDGLMPNMDGLEATRRIRDYERTQGKPRTPIIAVTAHALAGDREQFLASGMDEYLTKPVRKAELAAAIERVAG